jgi:hypothetical protein
MKKCLDLSIFGYSATNHTPNQTPYSSIPDNERKRLRGNALWDKLFKFWRNEYENSR